MTVAVALSGGVDSAVAAYLLKKEGHRVWGITMIHHADMEGSLPKVKAVAESLDIPLEVVDLQDAFRERVIDPFIRQYAEGRTPSPCPICNRVIKMGLLMDEALSMRVRKMATGHYARVWEDGEGFHLLRGKDKRKDQSYFLSLLSQEQLSRFLLPLGGLKRVDVEKTAYTLGFSGSGLHGSQEICFLTGHYTGLLREQGLDPGPGNVRDVQGKIIGEHRGYIHYTVGQRRGLGVAKGVPLYVVQIIPEENTIVVGPEDHLFSREITVFSPHWIHEPCGDSPWRLDVKIRYRHTGAPALVRSLGDKLDVLFETPQRAPTPGQLAVFYRDDEVLGGGWIEDVHRAS